jgi:heat shock 70kDa protein 1/2/6/8
VLRLISDTSATALAYGAANRHTHAERDLVVFDWGSGSLSVAVLNIDTEENIYQVKAVAGHAHLGGDDIDDRLVDHFSTEFRRQHHKDMSRDLNAMTRLRTACEHVKRALSHATAAQPTIDNLHDGKDFKASITRTRFEDMTIDLLRRCIEPVERVLRDTKLKQTQIHEVVITGGSSRIPKMQSLLRQSFKGKQLYTGLNDESVCIGATMMAAILSNTTGSPTDDFLSGLLLLDVVPHSLGVEVAGGNMVYLITRNRSLPAQDSETFTTCTDNQSYLCI